MTGQLFVGKSFNALTSPTPPKFAHYMDTAFHAWYLNAFMPRTFALLQRLPLKPQKLADFLQSGDGVFEVCPQLSSYFSHCPPLPAFTKAACSCFGSLSAYPPFQ